MSNSFPFVPANPRLREDRRGNPGDKHSKVSKPGSSRPWERTESVAPHANTYSIVKQPIGFERIALSPKKIGPCSHVSGQRVALIPSLLPSLKARGSARHKAHDPGCPGSVRECVAPGRARIARALGVKRHAPRLAARQRSILAFMPLTVVGPGRLLRAEQLHPPGVGLTILKYLRSLRGMR